MTASLPLALAVTSASSKNLRRPCAQQRGLGDRPRLAAGLVEPVEPGIGIGLQDPGIVVQMPLGMLAGAVARVEEHRRRRSGAGERLVVAHIDPQAAFARLVLGQYRHRRVVAVHAIAGKHMGADQLVERPQQDGAAADLVGQRRHAEIDALARIALGLPVERLMLPVLLEQDHGEQARSGEAARQHVERRRRLADLLAIPAGELLAHGLHHLPLPRHRPRASRSRPRRAWRAGSSRSRRTSVGPGTTTRSRGRCAGNGLRAGFLRVNARTGVVAAPPSRPQARPRLAAASSSSSSKLHLVEQARLALVARSEQAALELLDRQLQMRDQSLRARRLGAHARCLGARLRKLGIARQHQPLQRLDIVGERISRAHRAKWNHKTQLL